MPEVIIKGIPVKFPFEPYSVQIAYMEKVINCLERGGNGVLESPTGTGKTLSLLCASCAWLTCRKAQLQAKFISQVSDLGLGASFEEFQSLTNKSGSQDLSQDPNIAINMRNILFRAPKIIYASRTHSQLTQVVQELKRTSYSYMKVSVLGSRDQMCVHPEVSKEETNASKTISCRMKVKSRTCHFHNNVDKKKDEFYSAPDILDIEDLVKLGRKLQCCPYYVSRELSTTADIIFMPYNYLLEVKTRKNLGLELGNSIIILDEAHNIEKVCEEAGSLSLSNTDVAMCVEEVSQVMKEFAERQERGFNVIDDDTPAPDFTADDLCLLKTLFLELEITVDDLTPGTTFPGDYIFELLQKVDLTPGKRNVVVDVLMKVVMYLSTTSSSPFQRKGAALQKFTDLLNLVFKYEQDCPAYIQQLKTSYKVHVSLDESNKKKSNSWAVTSKASQGKIVNFWCFCPQFGIEYLMTEGIHSLILTSGTLSPLDCFISELGIDVLETLENPHIVGEKQVCVAVLKKGPDGCELNSSYNSRNNPNYLSSLGRTIVNLSYIVPDGVLIFFPSYFFMKSCQDAWQQSGIWSQIEKNKPIFVEPRNKNDLNEIMNGYYNKIQDPTTRGACFMAVTRGKVSEGLDFADFNGRAVVVTGLPYPPFKDPRVELKKAYLNEIQKKGKKSISGTQWYTLEATKAVNQAVGRVIRHANDFGIILLCDSRFDSPFITNQLSSWIRPHIKKYAEFGPLVKTVREFFRFALKELPPPKGKSPVAPSSFNFAGRTLVDVMVPGLKRSHSVSSSPPETSTVCNVDDYRGTQEETQTEKCSAQPQSSSGVLGELNKNPSSVIDFNDSVPGTNTVSLCSTSDKSADNCFEQLPKKRKLKIVPLKFEPCERDSVSAMTDSSRPKVPHKTIVEYVKQVRNELGSDACTKLKEVCSKYKTGDNIDDLFLNLKTIFCSSTTFHLLQGYEPFVRRDHRELFRRLVDRLMRSS